MLRALPPAEQPVAEALAEAALRTLEGVATMSDTRENALPLLAADALLTHAFQALTDDQPECVGAFAERCGGAGSLGALAETLARR